MTATMSDIWRASTGTFAISSPTCGRPVPWIRTKTVGISSAAPASISIVICAVTAVGWNRCRTRPMPP